MESEDLWPYSQDSTPVRYPKPDESSSWVETKSKIGNQSLQRLYEALQLQMTTLKNN